MLRYHLENNGLLPKNSESSVFGSFPSDMFYSRCLVLEGLFLMDKDMSVANMAHVRMHMLCKSHERR